MLGNNTWLLELIIILVGLGIIALVTFLITKARIKKFFVEQQEKAENIVLAARDSANVIELEARDQAYKALQENEAEITRRRTDLAREEDRLQKRRTEIDQRIERVEQRELSLNKRQSAMDKRANEVEELFEKQMEELQRVAEMTIDEARVQLLADTEKDAHNDMARII
ncbi:DUF3552 domain-containing protein, partial [bacterium]|nr:DUF3552 domain-containing protein [bacterium]